MSKKTFIILISALAIAISAMIWVIIKQDDRSEWNVCYPMTNRNVEWTGAGYSGIYRR